LHSSLSGKIPDLFLGSVELEMNETTVFVIPAIVLQPLPIRHPPRLQKTPNIDGIFQQTKGRYMKKMREIFEYNPPIFFYFYN
jgi:hypothetical protein